jgi:hypothetical protein
MNDLHKSIVLLVVNNMNKNGLVKLGRFSLIKNGNRINVLLIDGNKKIFLISINLLHRVSSFNSRYGKKDDILEELLLLLKENGDANS